MRRRWQAGRLQTKIDAVALQIVRSLNDTPEDFDGREPLWIRHAELTNKRDGIA